MPSPSSSRRLWLRLIDKRQVSRAFKKAEPLHELSDGMRLFSHGYMASSGNQLQQRVRQALYQDLGILTRVKGKIPARRGDAGELRLSAETPAPGRMRHAQSASPAMNDEERVRL